MHNLSPRVTNCPTYYRVAPFNMFQSFLFSKIRSIYTMENHRVMPLFFIGSLAYYQHLCNAWTDFRYFTVWRHWLIYGQLPSVCLFADITMLSFIYLARGHVCCRCNLQCCELLRFIAGCWKHRFETIFNLLWISMQLWWTNEILIV